jgi:hypothetical protein
MSKQQKAGDRKGASRPRGGEGVPPAAGARREKLLHDRLEAIERADDRTAAFDPHRAGLGEDAMEDLLDGEESNAAYREEAKRVTPTLGPSEEGGGEH